MIRVKSTKEFVLTQIATNALVIRRKITIVKRMRKYLDAISHDPRLMTTVLPLGDGLAVSYKKID